MIIEKIVIQIAIKIYDVTRCICYTNDTNRMVNIFLEGRGQVTSEIVDQLYVEISSTLQPNNLQIGSFFVNRLPVTLLQHAMVAQSITNPNSGNAVGHLSCTMLGSIDAKAFQKSWDQSSSNMLACSTKFSMESSGEILQSFPEHASNEVNFLDWQSLNKQDQELKLQGWLIKDRRVGFDVLSPPLVRCTVIQSDKNQFHIIWTFHNAILDESSVVSLVNDALTSYLSLLSQKDFDLPERNNQFLQFLLWRKDSDTNNNLRFWEKQIEVIEKPLELKCSQTINKKSAEISIQRKAQVISREVASELKDFTEQNGITLRSLLHTAWSLTLFHLSDSEHLIFGSARKCRFPHITEIDDAAGMMVNTVPFIVKLDRDESYLSLACRVHDIDNELLAHEHVPLDQIRKLSNIDPGTPLFDSLLMVRSPNFTTLTSSEANEIKFTDFTLQGQTGLPLAMIITEEDEIQIELEYNADRFPESTADSILNQFLHLLTSAPSHSEKTVGSVPTLDHNQHEKLEQWNTTHKEYDHVECLHHFFEAAVDRSPDATALIFKNDTLTYRQLESRANQLAHFLSDKGVADGEPVAILMDRSFEMVISIYATLKVGGAYLPLDPEHPSDRLNGILKEAGPRVLLTQEHLVSKTYVDDIAIVAVDSGWPEVAQYPTNRPECTTNASNLAYIFYTSGSTGKPKGVMNEHKGICNWLHWMQDFYSLAPDDCVLQKTPYTFDVSIREFFWPLMVGARLVIAIPNGHMDNLYLIDTIKEYSVTTINFVPSMLDIFLEVYEPESCSSLRRVMCTGEAIPKATLNQFFSKTSTPLYNLYGPTEAAVEVTQYTCRPDDDFPFVPIGRPFANTNMYILNSSGQHSPLGVAGELYIGGIQVARGYLKRPELTAAKFIADPFFINQPSKMYNTGDLARFLPDGNIEFLGREDFQVKFNGLRIELTEIENALLNFEHVNQAVVTCDESAGHQRLLAHIVLSEANQGWEENLRGWLKRSLPTYMIPQHFIALDSMPLSSAGKLDRKALPKPHHNTSIKILAAKESPSEQHLREMWTQILKIESIDLDDRFFELGGTSLLAISFIAQLGKKLGERFPTVLVFDTPTIRSFTASLWSNYFDTMAKHFPMEADDKKPKTRDTSNTPNNDTYSNEDIAIIGMSGRFPGAGNLDEFWENLTNGVESFQTASDDDLRLAGIEEDDIADEEYVRNYFSADDLDGFDANFFDYQPHEATIMDPQHRLFLELAWQALDNAGYSKNAESSGRVGVFGGIARDAYIHSFVSNHPQYKNSLGDFQVNIGNDKSFPSTRVAYKLNLRGPAINVQTACSTSGVALHLACQNLQLRECDMAIVGGCRVLVPEKSGYRYIEGSALSSDGHLFTFDHRASGMVRGSGGAFLIVKRLSDAIKEGDCIRAVIKATAINNDGNAKAGFTAPSVEGQEEVVTAALRRGGINPESIGYIEAHGTGTALGDPIEVLALNRAYRDQTDKKHFCRLGSVKTNVGHLDAGAATTGIIKSILALESGCIPPSLNFTKPNPDIDFENSPFIVASDKIDWKTSDKNFLLRAGVTSLGLGGTNFHTILEQAPPVNNISCQSNTRPCQILALSAKTTTSLNANIAGVIDYIQYHPEISAENLAYSMNTCRTEYTHRATIVLQSFENDKNDILNSIQTTHCTETNSSVALVFPARGTDVQKTLLELIESEPNAKIHILSCCQRLNHGRVISSSTELIEFVTSLREDTEQLFILEYTLAQLWITWGVIPRAVTGSGIGHFVAACISGLITLENTLEILVQNDSALIMSLLNTITMSSPTTTLLSEVGDEIVDQQTYIKALHQTQPTYPTEAICEQLLPSFHAHNITIVLECGPPSAKHHNKKETIATSDTTVLHLSSLYRSEKKHWLSSSLFSTLGELWLKGVHVNWSTLFKETEARKIPLPPFQFDRQRYWLDLPGVGPKCILVEAATEAELSNNNALLASLLKNHPARLTELAKLSSEPSAPVRRGFVGRHNEDMLDLLTKDDLQRTIVNQDSTKTLNVAFMFPGGGAQYLHMGKGLYERFSIFRSAVDEGLALFAARTGYDLKKVWFAKQHLSDWASQEIKRPSVQLPAIFILEMALARLWRSFGIEPTMLIGHSLGENTSACLSGVISYPDALGLVTLRGKLFEKTEAGAMLSVPFSSDTISSYLDHDLDIATINSPDQCVISGSTQQINNLHQRLENDDIEAHMIPIQTAAHSRLLDPVLTEFGDYLHSIELHPPTIPFLSNVSGDWIKDDEATDPNYWVKHLRSTVRFADNLLTVLKRDNIFFLETGPGKTLCSLVKNQQPQISTYIQPSLRHPKEESHDQIFLLNSVCRMLVAGVKFNWNALRHAFPELLVTITTKSLVPFGLQPPTTNTQFETIMPQVASLNIPPAIPTPNTNPQGRTTTMSRKDLLSTKVSAIISEMAGIDEQSMDRDTTFLNMGFDSLFLTQVNLRFKKAFKVKITLKQLLRDAPTIGSLAAFIDEQLPETAFQDELQIESHQAPATQPAEALPQDTIQPVASNSHVAPLPLEEVGNAALQQAIALQIQASNSLLACLQQNMVQQPVSSQSSSTNTQAAVLSTPTPPLAPQLPSVPVIPNNSSSPTTTGGTAHGPFAPLQKEIGDELNNKQKSYLADFIKAYTEKTQSSKKLAKDSKQFYADPRTVMGFKSLFKEMTYTLAAKRSKGSRVWDIDGNEYIDCMGGFGAIFFGHSPDFVVEALHKQLDSTLDYGPQSTTAGRIAKLICEFTDMDRASFCNTGSEAALATIRIARTVTGNELLVMFQGAYHGIFDEVLVRGQGTSLPLKNMPIAPGIPQDASNNILLLNYGDPKSLEIIREKAEDLAGVIVEPIQSRHPELQPTKFLQDLREITKANDVPLIFDEIITGFRLHPKGAQGWYGVEADIACYGKVIGGGISVGVVAGKEQYMDALDGGPWNFGDDSFPEAGVTYFAGTFVRHPIAMAALEATLLKFKEGGPGLQEEMNKKTAIFAERVNRCYRQLGIPIYLVYFGSAFFIRYQGQKDFEPLFWHHLRYYGAHHIWGNRPGFLTVAHSKEDLDLLVSSFEQAGIAMQSGGFFPSLKDFPVEIHKWTNVQREIWLAVTQGQTAGAAYNEQVMFDIDQDLDPEIFGLTLDIVANRHPSLRARVAEDEQGLQLLHYMRPDFASYDLQQLTPEELQERIQRLAQDNIDKPFDFQNGPLFRALLLKVSKTKNIFCICASHLVCDGWSLEKIMEDMAAYYTGISQSRFVKRRVVPSLTEKAAAYEAIEASDGFSASKKFWLSIYQDNVPPNLDLPLDRPRPRVRSFSGTRRNYYLDTALNDPMRQFAKAQGCTSFVMMLSTYLILLNRLTQQDDIVVGIPAAGQPFIGMPDLVSHNVSFLPFRAKIDTSKIFTQFLEVVNNDFMDAKDSQEFGFGELLKELNISRDPSRLPLVTASFNMDMAYNPLSFNEVLAKFIPGPRGLSKYDLLFTLTDEGDQILIEVDCNTDIIEAETIDRWINHYECLLREILKNSNQSIAKIPILELSQHTKIVEQWNATSRNYQFDKATLHGLFESTVDSSPDHIALIFEEQKITYRELDERANQLAHYLRENGITAEKIVAVMMERSVEMVIALYGILKAGGAYLPLDPDYPLERTKFILDESQTIFTLSQARFTNKLPDDMTRLLLDEQWSLISQYPKERPANVNSANNLAYVIYTSGSTGQPKGVMNEHRGVCNRLLWMQESIPLSSHDKVLQKTPYTFDVSVWEFFLPLLNGACLVLAKPEGHKDGQYLADIIRKQAITYLHFVPSMLHIFLSTKNADKCTPLTRVICSGEALSRELQDHFFQLLPKTELHNLYGPTEAAIDVTAWQCKPSDSSTTVPIGTPIANTQIYILDKLMTPVPLGVAGELFIGGVQVARGYINRPELTRERFIPDPFSTNPNAKLYKTGDLAKFRPDGVIEYLGRNDFQVKIRGLRIELEEIESILESSPSVKQCVVIAREDRDNDQRLVAYVIPTDQNSFDVTKLRELIQAKLPNYMMPQHFVELSSFPLTSSGKTDRKSLPAPVTSGFTDTNSYQPPSTETEKIIAACWEDVLDLQQVSIHDDFFELGGHSLLAIQVLAKINEQLGIVISLNMLFFAPTVHRLASVIEEELMTDETRKLRLSVPRRPEGESIPATSQQKRLWYLAQINPTYLSAHNNATALRFKGPLNLAALQQTIETIFQRHEILRTNLCLVGEELQQIVQTNSKFLQPPLSLMDFGAESIEDLISIHQKKAAQPVDIAKDPLCSFQIVRIEENDHALLLIINHLVFDGWSYDLLFKELSDCYNAFDNGATPDLKELPVHYADYAVWQQDFLRSPYVLNQLDFWKNTLSGELPLLDLPTDFPRPSVQSYDCQEIRFSFEPQLVESLEAVGKKHGCTLFMVLIALYTIMLHRFSRQHEIAIGFPISGRNIDNTSNLIGFFVNTLVARFAISPKLNFSDWLEDVKKVCLAAYNNQDTPFELIVQEIQPPRDLSRPPIFQTLFIYQDVRNRNTNNFENLEMSNFNIKRTALQTELDVWIKREKSGLWGGILYPTAILKESTAQQLADAFVELAQIVSVTPTTAITVLAEANKIEKELLARWNQTELHLPNLFFTDILKKNAADFADHTAIIYGQQQLSYTELDQQSTKLAHYLTNQGLKPMSFVGVYMNRSETMLIALIAIWKAGCTYVPLDPDYPESRLLYMIETASISLLLTESALSTSLAEYTEDRIFIDTEAEQIAKQKNTQLPPLASAEDLAYVIFTSGSTGKPKGVKVPHRAVTNFLLSMAQKPGLSNEDTLLAVTTLSFDIAVLELFLPLTVGATTVILNKESTADGEKLKKYLSDSNATVMQATPATWRMLLEADWQTDPSFKILCGGETFPQDLVEQLTAKSNNVWNMYGPTETTIWSSCHKIDQSDSTLFIGRPIANTEMHILDEYMKPTPLGVIGELHIGGSGVSKGYLNRPDLTEQQFIPNPFRITPGTFLYKTGDLARFHKNGHVECLGRVDNQVKVRGYRIELEEIESILSLHPDIAHSVVNVYENQPGDERLVAYIITVPEEEVTTKNVRQHVRELLPEYMIPQHVVTMEAFPLTPAGKIDRNSLPDPLESSLTSIEDYVEPSTKTEKYLSEIWHEILKIKRIGVHDNFFDLGGHSLLAVSLFAKIKKVFSCELPLAVLFKTPTVYELANRIDAELYLTGANNTQKSQVITREQFTF